MSEVKIEVIKVQRVNGTTLLSAIFNCPSTISITEIQLNAEFYIDGKNSIVPENSFNINPPFDVDGYGNYVIDIDVKSVWPNEYTDFGLYRLEISWEDTESDLVRQDEAIVSDVEFAYHCITSQLLKMGDCCADIPDTVIQAYLMLFGHQQAMRYRDFPKAKYFYSKIIQMCKGRCYTPSPCNCQ